MTKIVKQAKIGLHVFIVYRSSSPSPKTQLTNMSTPPLFPARLFMIMARQASTAVILRRGPSKWTQLIQWHTAEDRFEPGQWFKGRIYERRCDLSPDGTKLIYFASKFDGRTVRDRSYTYAWTAVSKPPWFTALALWPKGDCWHGGGLFENDLAVFLNHHPDQATPHPNHLPGRLKVTPNPLARGENEPLYSQRLVRDGWQLEQKWQVEFKYPVGFITHQPEVWLLPNPKQPQLKLQMTKLLSGRCYWEEYVLVDKQTKVKHVLPGDECALWDQRGRLVYAHQGKLWRVITHFPELQVQEIADFNGHQPEQIQSPAGAKRW
jgi:hypothetical protein